MGGTDTKDNLVLLTAREHFICHNLLARMYPDNKKLIFAFYAMCCMKVTRNLYYTPSSRMYNEAKELHKKSRLDYRHSLETRLKISLKNKGCKRTDEFKQNLSNLWKGKIAHNKGKETPEAIKLKISETMKSKQLTPWNKGKSTKTLICPHCNKLTDPGNAKQWHFNKCKFKVI